MLHRIPGPIKKMQAGTLTSVAAANLTSSAVGQDPAMINGTVVASVSGNALTLAIKTLAGNTPSVLDPVIFILRNTAPDVGNYRFYKVTSALSITVTSTATLGHVSSRAQQIIVYALDQGGTVELAVSTKLFDQSVRLVSTTIMNSSATSPATMYSTVARSGVTWYPIARCISTQGTAGTWLVALDQIDLAPFTLPTNICRIYLAVDQTGVTGATFTKVNLDTVDFDPDSIADVATNHRIQPKVPGIYDVSGSLSHAGTLSGLGLTCIAKNGSRVQNAGLSVASGATDNRPPLTALVQMNGTTDYLELQGFTSVSSGTATFSGNIAVTDLACFRVGP